MEALPATAMGLTHCPLCLGLAILCLVRSSCHLLMAWQLLPAGAGATDPGPWQPTAQAA
jgi:hypothetical protein